MNLTKEEIDILTDEFPDIDLSKIHVCPGFNTIEFSNRGEILNQVRSVLKQLTNKSNPLLDNTDIDKDLKFQTINSLVDGYQ